MIACLILMPFAAQTSVSFLAFESLKERYRIKRKYLLANGIFMFFSRYFSAQIVISEEYLAKLTLCNHYKRVTLADPRHKQGVESPIKWSGYVHVILLHAAIGL